MDVHLTFDIELWCGGWKNLDEKFPAAFRRYIYGPLPQETGALPLNLKILRDNGLKAIFFVEPLFSLRFGLAPLQEIVQLLLEHGQEVQLHLHPEWVDEIAPPLVARRAKTRHLHTFDRAEQGLLLAAAAARLEEAGAPRPTAFRAGNYSMNGDTLAALAELGFTVDSSLNDVYDFPYPVQPGEAARLCCSRLNGVAEFPVTVFTDGFGKKRPLHVTACSAAEMESALVASRDTGLAAATLVSHNFELLTTGLRREDRVVIRRFDRLCQWLAQHRDEFPVGSYDPELAQETPTAPSLPRVSPLATLIRHSEQLLRRVLTKQPAVTLKSQSLRETPRPA